MLYSHLQFEGPMNAVGRHRTRFVFFLNFFPYFFLWSGMSPRQLTLPVSFDTKKTLKFIRILRQCMQNMP